MQHSETRYLGEHGHRDTTFRAASEPAGYTTSQGTAGHYLASTTLTDGTLSLFRWDVSATSGGPSAHFHRGYAETFYVLSGTVRLYDGNRWFDANPGDLLYVPPGGIHAFRNESGAPAAMLIILTPGADREAYFAELAAIAAEQRELTDEEWADLMSRHDNVMVPH